MNLARELVVSKPHSLSTRTKTMRSAIKIRKKNSVQSSPEILAVDALVRVLVHAAPRLVLLLYGTVRDQFRPPRTDVRTRMRNHVRAFRNTVRGIADLVCARGNPVRAVGGGVRTQGAADQQGHHLTMVYNGGWGEGMYNNLKHSSSYFLERVALWQLTDTL
jgi:hypothetical protein